MDFDVNKTGTIPTFHVEDEIEMLSQIKDKPSGRIFQTKIGKASIELLKKIKVEHNHSWYKEIYDRAQDKMDKTAIFYRANKLSYRQMFEKADELARAMVSKGLKKGDKVACCLSNTPELAYIMLAANRIGVRLTMLSTTLNKEYMEMIMDGCSKKVMFCTDDNYGKIKDSVKKCGFEEKVVVSLADSLPEDPTKCDEYVPELDSYYHFDNHVPEFKNEDSSVKSFGEYSEAGKDKSIEVIDNNDLDTEFTETFTSGSTRLGYPKRIVHCNRAYIVGGIYNATNLTGSPDVPEIRGLAHIHSDSNTNLVTAISDNLIKGGCVAFEPLYSKETFLDCIVLNNPVHLDATTSFIVQAAKDYLIKKRFHQNGVGRKLPTLLVTMAVGERTTPGEEKFINKFLRAARAGSGIKLNGINLPYGPLSMGGGDCEHGGIYYTLLTQFQRLRNAVKLKLSGQEYGLTPVPFATVTALKKNADGEYEECDYGEYGIIVANSITSMKEYNKDPERTKQKVIKDKYGRDWLSCDCYGYINNLGNVVIKGRKEDHIILPDKTEYPCFMVDDVVLKDTKNIMSCSTVKVEINNEDIPVVNIELSPYCTKNYRKIFRSLYERMRKYLPEYIVNRVVIRYINNEESFPLTGSGKRDIVTLTEIATRELKEEYARRNAYNEQVEHLEEEQVTTGIQR